MKKYITAVLAISAYLFLGAGSFAGNIKFQNPVWNENFPDPTVILNPSDNLYYCLSTMGGDNLSFLKSSDLVNWVDSGIYPFDEETFAELHTYGANIWAPQIIWLDGRYVMYLAMYNSAKDSRIVALSSPSLTAPFKFEAVITDSMTNRIEDTIDPFVVEDKGQVWLFFGSTDGIYRTRLSKDGLSLFRKNEFRHVAGLKVSRNRNRSSVYEGSCLYRHKGYWYLFASAGNYNDHTYKLVVGRSRTLTGDFVDNEGNKMADGNALVLLETGHVGEFFGPGHCSEVISDDRNNTFILYHCHHGRRYWFDDSYIPRYLMLQRIYWDKDGWPYMKEIEMDKCNIFIK